MRFIIQMLKGAVMGIANVIPGVSGGTMAVSMGIYDTLINSITHLFKEFKKSFKTLLPIGLGMVVGIIGLASLIKILFEKAPVPTNLLFIGLILGGLPAVLRRLKGTKVGVQHVLGFIAFFALVACFAFISSENGAFADVTPSVVNAIKLFAVGIVSAATMVIPGVSGSMILKLMGYYEPVVGEISEFIVALKNWDMVGLKAGLFIFIPFGLGVVIGIVAIAKLIELLLKKFSSVVFSCILGLIIASPLAIVVMNKDKFVNVSIVHIILAVVCLVVGFGIAFILDKLGVKQEEQAQEKGNQEA